MCGFDRWFWVLILCDSYPRHSPYGKFTYMYAGVNTPWMECLDITFYMVASFHIDEMIGEMIHQVIDFMLSLFRLFPSTT